MKKILFIMILVAAGWAFYQFGLPAGQKKAEAPRGSGASQEAVSEISSYQYTQAYADEQYRFSFRYPAEFEVVAAPHEQGGEVVVVQNLEKRIGVQIVITPFSEGDIDLTLEMLRESVPDLAISEPQTVEIGTNRKGIAFKSDNPAFGGASREVWFVYKGNLYQISTYAEFDQFLQGLFGTWTFE